MDAHTLRISPFGAAAARILSAALEAIEPRGAVRRALAGSSQDELHFADQQLPLVSSSKLWVVGAGKASVAMTEGILGIFGERVHGGLVIDKAPTNVGERRLGPVRVVAGDHPTPGSRSLEATRALERELATAAAGDVVLAVISGGASSLLCDPLVSIADLAELTEAMLDRRMPIAEINTVRCALDRVKGGGLLTMAAPASVVGLIISDVVGDDPRDIGSGPTTPRALELDRAKEILGHHGLLEQLPASIRTALTESKPRATRPAPLANIIVAGNRDARIAGAAKARDEGFEVEVVEAPLEGAARHVGAEIARDLRTRRRRRVPQCQIRGGETVVEVQGHGVGGRNLELALAAAMELDGVPDVLLAALATDGEDGPSGAAGAVVDGRSAARARARGIDLGARLADNDSRAVFARLDDLLVTGPTGTNAADLVLSVCGPI